jgi:hypothetical protein
MAYVQIPKDLSNVKTKVMFNLTKRQLVCFSFALLIGLPLFFLLKGKVNISAATLIMIFSMMPFFLLALYEKHGQPLEVLARHYIEVRFLNPKQRPYKTNNFYFALHRQEKLYEEVKSIVKGKQKSSPKADKGRKTAD